ncbi:hypothetical protein GDO81_018608 [Engystomops pustulosus]|uniref:Uncharacterized protein n=1 Tax=Engystomops pustulosus TaxID=76066 RepID=A0AAV6ZGU4_ENGPU|nr:hypothetical protein GDO81_018608 [Engystomops pustulosus]
MRHGYMSPINGNGRMAPNGSGTVLHRSAPYPVKRYVLSFLGKRAMCHIPLWRGAGVSNTHLLLLSPTLPYSGQQQ